jgi:hypothetical protein
MNWFDKWIAKKVRKAWDDSSNVSLNIGPLTQSQVIGMQLKNDYSSGKLDAEPNLRFNMYRAENGYIMEVRVTDRRTERTHHNLHLIPDSEDLGKSISEIITLESLKVH